MARPRGKNRFLGPYKFRPGTWVVFEVTEASGRVPRYFDDEKEARYFVRVRSEEIGLNVEKTVGQAIDDYEKHLRVVKGNRLSSWKETVRRVRQFFPDHDLPIRGVDLVKSKKYYEVISKPDEDGLLRFSVDTHRNMLAVSKSFMRWCLAEKLVKVNPLEAVTGIGKRRHGKPQLRIDEARKWIAKAIEHADNGEDGAVAALMSLLMGMRASEIISRVIRDLDDDGHLLWIPCAKTEAGKRTLVVPEFLRGHLLEITAGRGPEEKIFGHHWRDWVRKWVQRIAVEAGVPEVSAHSMRGLHATLAVGAGMTPAQVIASLGHESFSTTARSYAKPEAQANAAMTSVLARLAGAVPERLKSEEKENRL